MPHPYFSAVMALASLAGAANSTAPTVASSAPTVISDIDLSKPFATRAPWRFTATQGPDIEDPTYGPDEKERGVIQLCLRASGSAACDPVLHSSWTSINPDVHEYDDLHYLRAAQIVRLPGAARQPLLWVQGASVHSGDGGQLISTQVLAYRPPQDRFFRVYERQTGSNGNEETRFIAGGPLSGDIISVEPTSNAPFGYWVSVSASKAAGAYHQVLRYRSATHYNDGNALAVIDSEMPNIQKRLGLWKPGQPIPTPAGKPCPKPTLRHTELWCE